MRKYDERACDALLELQGFEGVSNKAAIRMVGELIDLSGDLKRADGTNRALEWCDMLASRGLTNLEAALLSYFRANAWANRQAVTRSDRAAAWAWEQPEIQEQILHLRSAIRSSGFEELDPLRRCQILTNLANQLDTIGRFVEALEYWDRALVVNAQFGMALGNRGYALERCAKALYATSHRAVVLLNAHMSLTAALSPQARYEGAYDDARAFFATRKAGIERAVNIAKVSQIVNSHDHSLGSSEEEQRYRSWCLQNRLFLNPLNDLGAQSIAARDVLMLPSFVTPIHEPPTLIGLFNQMKQEFVSARWLFYEGAFANEVHFSDRGVALYNTLDYPSYALAVEKVKAAFRVAYSIFDKIGFFLNDYMDLGIDPKRVYFRSIWYEKQKADAGAIRPEFESSENWPLRGLFWLSKDFFDEDFSAVTEPDAQALYEIRNQLEHKYLKVHETLLPRTADESPELWRIDRLAYSLERRDLEAKTARLLKLARAGLIYLSLGMHRMEQIRKRAKGEAPAVPMSLDVWEDDWKL